MTEKKLQEMWNEYYPKVYGYFFKRLDIREDIEELTSNVVTQFLMDITNEEKNIKHPHGYLWKMSYFQFTNFIHTKSHKLNYTPIEDAEISIPAESEDFLSSQNYKKTAQELLMCIKDGLTMDEYRLVEKVYLEEKTRIEVAEIMNLKPEAVRQRLKRVMDKIRKQCAQIWKLNLAN
jgi:RNA polymerase sigma factor (sigma-70 family)